MPLKWDSIPGQLCGVVGLGAGMGSNKCVAFELRFPAVSKQPSSLSLNGVGGQREAGVGSGATAARSAVRLPAPRGAANILLVS